MTLEEAVQSYWEQVRRDSAALERRALQLQAEDGLAYPEALLAAQIATTPRGDSAAG